MRSTQIVLFLVLLNGAALFVAPLLPADVQPTAGGSDEIETAGQQVNDTSPSGSEGTGVLIGGFNAALSVIESIRTVVFYGPEMLKNLGAPAAIISMAELALLFIVTFDAIEAFTGRQLS